MTPAEQIAKQAAALADADQALKAATDYVAAVQPELDRFHLFQDDFLKRAHQIAGALAQHGIIESHETTALVDKLAENPLRALDLVEKVAKLVQPDSLGKAAEDVKLQQAQMAQLDPFEKLALFGDSQAVQVVNSGLVE